LATITIDIPDGAVDWIPESIRIPAGRALGVAGLMLSLSGDTPRDSDREQCESDCDKTYDLNVQMCNVDSAMRGRNPRRYKDCMDEVNRLYLQCYKDCKEECN